jgi:LPS-assembly protein
LDIVEGSRLKMNLESKIGQMENPIYQLKDGGERGDAKRLFMEGDNQYLYKHTCDHNVYLRYQLISYN